MARVAAILGALARAVRRDVGTFGSLGLNNFFFFIALMMYGAAESHMEPKSAYPMLLLLMIVMLFPLSSDPLEKVPPSRLALWPLSARQRVALRITSLALSPVVWLAVAFMLFKRIRPGTAIAFLTALIGVQMIAIVARVLLARVPRRMPFKWIPPLPGKLGGLIRNHMRQMFQVLDLYVALILTLGAIAYRFLAAHPDPDAFLILAVMVALAMSTYAQSLFGLDRASGAMPRYRLFPLRGWEVLLAKDAAYLAIVALLVSPLDALAGIPFAMFALAVGHHASVLDRIPLRRWRFTAGRAGVGVVQSVGGFIFGLSAHRVSRVYALASLAIYVGSLAFYGWRWDRASSLRT
jgi:hypothetical protein